MKGLQFTELVIRQRADKIRREWPKAVLSDPEALTITKGYYKNENDLADAIDLAADALAFIDGDHELKRRFENYLMRQI